MVIFMVHEVMAHEIIGSLGGAYFDRGTDSMDQENADKSARKFGMTKTGAKMVGTYKSNLTSGDSRYLIECNWQANIFVKEVVNNVDNDYSNIR
jgi:hypothetical protein